MVMMSGAYWGHGAAAVMAVIGMTWVRMAAHGAPASPQPGQERRMADVLAFPAPKLPSEFEVFAERERLLG